MTEEIKIETVEEPAETESVRRGVPSGAPEKPQDSGGFKNPPLRQDDSVRRDMTADAGGFNKPQDSGGFKNPPLRQDDSVRRGMTADAGGFKNPPLRGAPEKPDDPGKLAELETALSEARQSLAARTGDYDRLKAALDDTVSAYRKLAVSSSPLYSDDMISGSTVEEIDASIKKVNGMVKKMRSTLEAELKDLTIPAGAPERSAPDLSGLSPRDKIKYGIQEKK